MAKYLFRASYTAEGTRGLIKGGGGTARKAAIERMMEGLDGRLEGFYYAFGEDDVYVIAEAPDHISAAAASLAINAAGAAVVKTTVLLSPEDMDKAAKKTVTYRAPGQ